MLLSGMQSQPSIKLLTSKSRHLSPQTTLPQSFIGQYIGLSVLWVGFSPSKKFCFIESPLKVMGNAFYFILKALFILKIFKFLSRLFGHVGKTAFLER